MCNIYRIHLNRKAGYDEFNGAIVIAFSEKDARETFPAFDYEIPSIDEQIKNPNGRIRCPLDVRRANYQGPEYSERGPWKVTHHYSLALGFHIKFNGRVFEKEQELYASHVGNVWTADPDNVRVELIGIVPEDMNYHPRVVLTDFRAG